MIFFCPKRLCGFFCIEGLHDFFFFTTWLQACLALFAILRLPHATVTVAAVKKNFCRNCLISELHRTAKQGSSENDGGSDVYDRSECTVCTVYSVQCSVHCTVHCTIP